ncbi:nucleoside recognition protein [Caldicellulosiruptor changbaiensis]|uniref:Nucleoside recognition protein n=1 Tax=Caldicellulosiruptor changbaiensis TaxID=1222016 RepID=A0A3T0D5Z4_9FIRM|nr:nucleoside recognition protein [Caldicellulosiruptor changbaiensis]AZT90476.1 nucleoside recognition protein [Caldicellulosiruptor changbaiensis]
MKNIYNFTIIILCLLYFVCIFLNPHAIIETTKTSILLWAQKIVTSLFPYFLIINVFVNSRIISYVSYIFLPVAKNIFKISSQGLFAFIIGLLSGYPVGIKTVCSLYKENLITKKEATKLLHYVNNSGPLFIIGTVGINLLNSKTQGYILFFAHTLASIIIALFVSVFSKIEWVSYKNYNVNINFDLGNLLSRSVKDSIEAILLIGGFITLFFNLNFVFEYFKIYPFFYNTSHELFVINKDLIQGLLYGFFEITSGTILISKSQTLSAFYKLLACVLIISWGGMSVHFQAISFLKEAELPIKTYLIGKCIHAILSVVILLIIFVVI